MMWPLESIQNLLIAVQLKRFVRSPKFIEVLSQHEVHITLLSDAHFRDDVGTFLKAR
jgi:histidinol phosphatase-like PHP family hydrolase